MGRVWITADVLAKRLKAGGKSGIVELGYNELLTPNAADLADQRHVAVRRLAPPGVPKALNGKPQVTPAKVSSDTQNASGKTLGGAVSPVPAKSIGVVLDRPTELVRSLVDSLYRVGLPLADFSMDSCWIRNTRSMCDAVAGGQLAGGIIIRPYAAEAMVLANKVRGVRAVQGTTRAAVAAGIRQFEANVLVIEHAARTFHEIRVMMETFAAGLADANAVNPLLKAVGELEGT
jgi:ribose 5-phosphate isomerase RpiB